jgi:hypothetical protein
LAGRQAKGNPFAGLPYLPPVDKHCRADMQGKAKQSHGKARQEFGKERALGFAPFFIGDGAWMNTRAAHAPVRDGR